MFDALYIGADAKRFIWAECCKTRDNEAVGLLFGRNAHVTDGAPLTNHDTSLKGSSFAVLMDDVDRTIAAYQSRGLDVIGRYHTHVHVPAMPSPRDIRSLPSGWVELIVRLGGPSLARRVNDFRAYREGQEIPVVVSNCPPENTAIAVTQ